MSWLASFGIAFLNAPLGLILGGFIGAGCVAWFNVSSFEGKSGFAIVGAALLGGVLAFIAGLVAARCVAASAHPGFGRGWVAAAGSSLALAAVIVLFCWLASLVQK